MDKVVNRLTWMIVVLILLVLHQCDVKKAIDRNTEAINNAAQSSRR